MPLVEAPYGGRAYACTILQTSGHASAVAIREVCSANHGEEAVTLTITNSVATTGKKGITIAGAKAFTKLANAEGVATFNVNLTQVGTYALVATNAAGAVISTQSVTLPAVAVAGVSANAPAATGAATQLSKTGFAGMPLALGGGALVLAGAGAVLVARRRRSPRVPA